MTILLLAGSPSERSRSAALLDAVQLRLRSRAEVERLALRDLPPQALLLADAAHRGVLPALEQVARARAVVVATPVYKAAYSGVLKVFLDLLPQAIAVGPPRAARRLRHRRAGRTHAGRRAPPLAGPCRPPRRCR